MVILSQTLFFFFLAGVNLLCSMWALCCSLQASLVGVCAFICPLECGNLSSLTKDPTQVPLHWKASSLPFGPPGKSLNILFTTDFSIQLFIYMQDNML